MNFILKNAQWSQQTFFPKKHTDGKQAQEMMLYICNLQRNANPHQQKLPPHIDQNSNQEEHNKCWQGCGEKEIFEHCWWECKLVYPVWET